VRFIAGKVLKAASEKLLDERPSIAPTIPAPPDSEPEESMVFVGLSETARSMLVMPERPSAIEEAPEVLAGSLADRYLRTRIKKEMGR